MVTAKKTKRLFTIEELINEQQEFDATPRSLRNQLIEAPKNGEFITLPENTVNLEVDSSMVLDKDFPYEIFGYIAGIMQEHSDVFADMPIGREDGPFQLSLQKDDTTLGDLRQSIHDREDKNDANNDDNFKLNFLYSGETNTETPELSGVLVFGNAASEQLESLRDKLPEGVPLLDGETNELLDEIGADQREKGQLIYALRGYLASVALMSYFQSMKSESSYTTGHSDTYTGSSDETHHEDPLTYTYDSPFMKRYTHHDNYRFSYSSTKASRQKAKSRHQNQQNNKQDNTYDYQQPPQSSYEESDDTKLDREAVSLMNREAQKLGVALWVDLDRKGLSRIERRIARQLHTDQNENGNDELLKKITNLIAQKRGPLESFTDSDETANDATATAPQSESQPDSSHETPSDEMSEERDSIENLGSGPAQPRAIGAAPVRLAITSTPHNESQQLNILGN